MTADWSSTRRVPWHQDAIRRAAEAVYKKLHGSPVPDSPVIAVVALNAAIAGVDDINALLLANDEMHVPDKRRGRRRASRRQHRTPQQATAQEVPRLANSLSA
jgi:hypothetical protein